MVLVNGADGIGTGWMTKIPNYNPREIIENLFRMMDDADPKPMVIFCKTILYSSFIVSHFDILRRYRIIKILKVLLKVAGTLDTLLAGKFR